ncbi:MAG: hypothetical protein ACRDOK_19480 [Streptosporangiaceae bacterium]
MQLRKKVIRRTAALVGLIALPLALVVAAGTAAASAGTTHGNGGVTTSSLGNSRATFAGPAATGCASGCSLLSGPNATPSTANPTGTSAGGGGTGTPESDPDIPVAPHSPVLSKTGPDPAPPTVSCQPPGRGCDRVSQFSGGAVGVKGLNAVDSATQSTNVDGLDIEPADQGLCAGNGYVVESNNLGEILVLNTKLHRESPVISLDTVMGLTNLGWSSGGDISCTYDYANGGHWFITEIVSASPESASGAFAGCFAGVANACYEGIAVTAGNSPFGPYNVYYAHADYNPAEPGYPYLLNDFAKIATSRDAFLLFYDEFPLVTPGLGGGGFNGAQELAFNKNALERGEPTTLSDGRPNPAFTMAIENMGLLPTPNGTCTSDDQFHAPGITCWYSVIPAAPPDPSQYDNSHGGSAFMLESLDFYGSGDNRLAVFDWTGLGNLNSWNCSSCAGIRFGGQLFSGVNSYIDVGALAPQKAGPIPLGDECGAASLSVGSPPPASCPEGGIATNGDNFTEASQAGGQLWGAISTEVDQTFASEATPELHQGAAYWVIGTTTFDWFGSFSLTSQGYVSAAHEELEFPAMAAEGYPWQDGGNGAAILSASLSGNGGPTGADNGGFYPSTAFGRVTSFSGGLLGSTMNIADLGQSPADGFTEYQGFPGPTRARWGDYGAATFLPWSGGKIYFATNYIQSPNCTGAAFTLTLGTCSGTRDGFANWGTSVNSVVP